MTKYKIIKTDDGSMTIYAEEYSQAMHTTSGAYEESYHKHIIPSKILEKNIDHLFILDMGFGLGYNSLVCIYELMKKDSQQKITIISLEKQKEYNELMNQIVFNDKRDEYYSIIKKAYTSEIFQSLNINLKIIFGDARQRIGELKKYKFDAVFHDPYSPSKNPELWTVDYFKKINEVISPEGILTTYSSAPQVRMALLEAGFQIGRGPAFGKKREGTVASRNVIDNALPEDEIKDLYNNIKATPYRDENLNFSREVILKERSDEMKRKRTKPGHPILQE